MSEHKDNSGINGGNKVKDAHKCDICGKVLSNSSNLKIHKKTHSTDKPYQCSICLKYFKLYTYLVQHVKRHTNEKPFKCDVCGFDVKTKGELESHKKIHDDTRAFTCHVEECHYSSKTISDINRHIKYIHEKIRPFQCDRCDKSFYSQWELDKHQTSHSDDRKYVCNICGNGYKRKDYLVYHMKISHSSNRNFKCDECSHTSKTKSHLDIHMIKHSTSRPFSCEIDGCNLSFKTNSPLKAHLRGPHDIGANICDNCQEPHYSSIKHPDSTLSGYKVCKDCYKAITGQPYRVEHVVSEYLDESKEIKQKLVSSDTAMKSLRGCSRRRPDKLYINTDNKVIVIVEVDEYQHTRSTDYRCDEARLTEIYDEFEHYRDYHMIVIRFNPDSYVVREDEEKETLLEDRLNILQDTLWNFLFTNHGLQEHEKIFVYYMYYDEDSDIIVENIPHFMFQ